MGIFFREIDAASYSSIRAGGRIKNAVYPETVDELSEFYETYGSDALVFGGLTNTLVMSEGTEEKVIFTDLFKKCLVHDNKIIAGAGEKLSYVARLAEFYALSGLENLSGIPGTIGGAIMGNAGSFGSSISDVIDTVTVFELDTGITRTYSATELTFGYRQSGLRRHFDIITSATLSLTPSDPITVAMNTMKARVKRKESQPNGRSLGCVFKNPTDASAGKLIEDAGLKGTQIGGMRISEIHANFIINDGHGTPEEYVELMELAQNKVWESYGVILEREVIIVSGGVNGSI
jgi:UDP-N-acetylmuramate dehydrogenase